MMIVHAELLAKAYLIVLAPDPASTSELELAQHLSYAVRSNKPAVWVDCRLLRTLSPAAARLLLACQRRLRQRQAELVLCRPSEGVARALQQVSATPAAALPMVYSLDEAATHRQDGSSSTRY